MAGTSQRSRKKWRPQREHRKGVTSHESAFSTAFRGPTTLESIDLQCAHREENILNRSAICCSAVNLVERTRKAIASRVITGYADCTKKFN